MRILAVRARAFGPLLDQQLSLLSGMNVIYGLNEAGKSSWHATIFAGLCGMRRSRGSRRKEDREFVEQHRPWAGNGWAAEVDLELLRGRRIQIIQDLADPAGSRALDMTTGKDVTKDLINDGVPDGASLLGLTRDILPETLFIRQAEILRIHDNAHELQEQLQRAAASSGSDHTAEAAINRIQEFYSHQVGIRRRNVTRPLQTAMERQQLARTELKESRAAHEAYLELVDRRNRAEREWREAHACLRESERAVSLRQASDLRTALERARELTRKFPEGEPRRPSVQLEQLSVIQEALTTFERRPDEPAPLDGPTSADLESSIHALPDPPAGDLEPAEAVLAAERHWRTALRETEIMQSKAPPAPQVPQTHGLSPSELRSGADALELPVPEVDDELRIQIEKLNMQLQDTAAGASRKGLLLAGTALAVGGALMATLGSGNLSVAGFVVLGVAVVILLAGALRSATRPAADAGEVHTLQARLAVQEEAARQAAERRERAGKHLRGTGLPDDPERLRSLARTAEDVEVLERERRRWHDALEDSVGNQQRAATHLLDLLQPRILSTGSIEGMSVDDLLNCYRTQCKALSDQANRASSREALEREMQSRRAAEQAFAEAHGKRREAEERLRDTARSTGIEHQDIQQVFEGLTQFKSESEEEIDRSHNDRDAWGTLQEILKGRSVDELEEQLARLELEIPDAERAESGTPQDGTAADVEAALAQAQGRAGDARSELDHLAGQVVQQERTLPDVVAAEEGLSQAEAELERVEALGETLTTTREFLEAARDRVQRDIAPRLKAAVESKLPRITDDRYHEVLINPADLSIRVRPRGGDWRSAIHLSHGTTEQIYLLLRLAVAEHLVTTGESAPVLLDDVTVQSDARRSVAILGLLHEISAERQVILFSQEQEVLDWARSALKGPADQLIELSDVDVAAASSVS